MRLAGRQQLLFTGKNKRTKNIAALSAVAFTALLLLVDAKTKS
jgi:hypothetical protein